MIGKTVSHYRIIEKLGQGGMGEVYRAVDTNLRRHVAIKVLPDEFVHDAERLARFQREAEVLASLNHLNIAAIHGLEESAGKRFIVMELVEGQTLAQRLLKGPLPIPDALETCRQIVEGLEAAHEKGIIHRDLKPANVMITADETVKILDFGLAKALAAESPAADATRSPTITEAMTRAGTILGTAAYMSPEQAKGKAVDRRADIWAFGCILYECLTGQRAFRGETVTDTIAKVLEAEPDWRQLPAQTPAFLRTVLQQCLQKNPKLRLHDIADARIEIGESASREVIPTEAMPARRRFSLAWLAMGGAVVLLVGILIGRVLTRYFQPASSDSVVRSTVKVEPGHRLEGLAGHMELPSRTAMAISRDARFIVYSAIEENPGPQAKPQLYLRRMDQSAAKPIAGTEGGTSPFLSPDSRWVGFWADGKLKKVLVEGGVPTPLCNASELRGADWGGEDRIVFTETPTTSLLSTDRPTAGLSIISADGGKPATLTRPDPKREEDSHRLPSWLPNGKAVLFTVMKFYFDPKPWLALLRLDTGEWRVLLEDAADARYVPTGHLVFLRQGTLMAARFDLARLQVIGEPVALVENVRQALGLLGASFYTGAGQFDISDTGSLIYAAGGIVPSPKEALVWVDQKGMEQPLAALQLPIFSPRLSPDGHRIAYVRFGPEFQVYVYDLIKGTNTPLTQEGWTFYTNWTPDGKRLLFSWGRSSIDNLFWQPYDRSAPMERLTTSQYCQRPGSWSSDGRTFSFVEIHPDTGSDIAVLDVPSGRVTSFLNSQSNEMYPEFSPVGPWIAYTSDLSKRDEVYVTDYPGRSKIVQLSSEGGRQPLWARNGKQLFYRRQNQVWVVDVRTDGGFATSKPRLLFEKPGYGSGFPIRDYDLSLDSQRFLMVKQEQQRPAPITEMILVQNWFEELKRLVPTK